MDPKTKKILLCMGAALVLHDIAISTHNYSLRKLWKSHNQMRDIVNQNANVVNDLVEAHNNAVVDRVFPDIVDRFDD